MIELIKEIKEERKGTIKENRKERI